MLSKEEEQRLAACSAAIRREVNEGRGHKESESLTVDTIAWLTESLGLINEELKQLKANHNELDQMLATALQVINDAGIMSEYLKFRNQ